MVIGGAGGKLRAGEQAMEKLGVLSIAAGVGMMLLGEGHEIIDLWLGHTDGKATVVQVGKLDAVGPDHGSHREAAGQRLELARATQVATPSAMIWYGAPESPRRI
jgi:hypothetical protein